MTREEARARWICCPMCDKNKCKREADDCDVNKALERELILDKIRAEINSLAIYGVKFKDGLALHVDKNNVLQIIDKYKIESDKKESDGDA